MSVKEKRTYADRREYLMKAVSKRRHKLKDMSIEYKGGKCQLCDYNKCKEALEFHHIDPDKKDFSISADGFTRSWQKIKDELDKCVMLCSNCHREVHFGLAIVPNIISYEVVDKKPEQYNICSICSNSKSIKKKFCSTKCQHIAQLKINWLPIDELLEKLKTTSYVALGKELGVSDNAIRNHINKYKKDLEKL